MSRRAHRKSKTGCVRCKSRHIKCDEHRPKCINCTTAGFECKFLHAAKLSINQEISISQKYRLKLAIDENISSSEIDIKDSSAEINVLDLQLFYNFISKISFSFWSTPEYDQNYDKLVLSIALQHRCLMSELLAFSALYISEHEIQKRQYYRSIATAYQNRALSGLKESLEHLDESNCTAVLLLSNLIGLHSFRTVFASLSESVPFSDFLMKITHLINLQRGVRAVIHPYWSWFLSSPIGPAIRSSHDFRLQCSNMEGSDTETLKQFILSKNLGTTTNEIYLKELEYLQLNFNQVRLLRDNNPKPLQGLFAWLVTISREFLQSLEAEQAEALLILSFYGVVLHHYREYWLVRDAGRILVNFVIERLGLDYSSCLQWAHEQTNSQTTERKEDDQGDLLLLVPQEVSPSPGVTI
ncbi:uncharacterized protein V1516DRAFT_674251 [Lipomyces oligophaga]|uniref:uncharacterized protein n=1 Tax=Lipomyces oligophaga TaxID=45792 RepID=UPI0034CF761D